jgi:hypothetical protein
MYDRLTGTNRDLLEIINPKAVDRHRGDRFDYLRRLHKEARLVAQIGPVGRQKVASQLVWRIADARTLRLAWDHLSEHGGQSPGPDGLKYADFREEEIWPLLREIRDEILEGFYRAGRERLKRIPKGSGRDYRTLAIQSILDRVVQHAAVVVLQPLLDPLFDEYSFGYRPRRSRLDALIVAEQVALKEKRRVWVATDIRDAFVHVPVPRSWTA